jgi:hypothetical protein
MATMQGSRLTNKAHRFELSFAETKMDVVAQLTDFPNWFSTASSLLDVVAQLTLTRQPTCTEEISKQYTSLSFHYSAPPSQIQTKQGHDAATESNGEEAAMESSPVRRNEGAARRLSSRAAWRLDPGPLSSHTVRLDQNRSLVWPKPSPKQPISSGV